MKIFLNENEPPSSHTLYCKVKTTFLQLGRVVPQAYSLATVPLSLRLGVSREYNDANPEGWRHKGKPEACSTKP